MDDPEYPNCVSESEPKLIQQRVQVGMIHCDEYKLMDEAQPGVNCEDGSQDNLRNADAKTTAECFDHMDDPEYPNCVSESEPKLIQQRVQVGMIHCDEYKPMDEAQPGVNCEDGSQDNLRNADAKTTAECFDHMDDPEYPNCVSESEPKLIQLRVGSSHGGH